jgi:hypothetical protein
LIFKDSISDYLDELCSPSGPPLVVCEPENNGEGVLNQQSFSFDIEHGEENEILDRDSLPLCFLHSK